MSIGKSEGSVRLFQSSVTVGGFRSSVSTGRGGTKKTQGVEGFRLNHTTVEAKEV